MALSAETREAPLPLGNDSATDGVTASASVQAHLLEVARHRRGPAELLLDRSV